MESQQRRAPRRPSCFEVVKGIERDEYDALPSAASAIIELTLEERFGPLEGGSQLPGDIPFGD